MILPEDMEKFLRLYFEYFKNLLEVLKCALMFFNKHSLLILAENPPKRFAFSSDLKSLTIRDVCRDCVDRESKTDLMAIQCNGSNVHGYALAQGYLNVLSKCRLRAYLLRAFFRSFT